MKIKFHLINETYLAKYTTGDNRFEQREEGEIPLFFGAVMTDYYFIFIPTSILIHYFLQFVYDLRNQFSTLKIYTYQLSMFLVFMDGNVENLEYLGINQLTTYLIANTPFFKFYAIFCVFLLGLFTILSISFYPIFYFFHDKEVFLFFGKIRSLLYGNMYFIVFVVKLIFSAFIHAAFK